MKNFISQIQTRPALYQQSQANIWTDPYLSQKMLEAHLDETTVARHAGETSSGNPQPGSHPSCRRISIPSFWI